MVHQSVDPGGAGGVAPIASYNARPMSGASARRWAVFLDRDGVLVDAVARDAVAGSARSLTELRVLDGAAAAIALLHGAGASCLVVTNQPDVRRGSLAIEDLDQMHALLQAQLAFDDVAVCPHDGRDGCMCRKPLPGMLIELAGRHHVDLGASWLVGDRWVDIAAGRAAGVRTVLVEQAYSWEATSAGGPPTDLEPDLRASDVMAAAQAIVAARGGRVPLPAERSNYSSGTAAKERTT